MITDRRVLLDGWEYPKMVGVLPAGTLAEHGIYESVPIVEMVKPADQRKWCVAVQEWLEHAIVPAMGCPTGDLIEGGCCQRSPCDGRCLLLLPFDHPDWQPALREEYDSERHVFRWREESLAPPLHRLPLSMEEVVRW